MNKKTVIIVVCVLTICVAVTAALTFVINISLKHEEPLVYITRTGSKYHSRDCGYLWGSAIPIGMGDAIKSGYTVCSRCRGVAIGTITVNNYDEAFGISALIVISLVLCAFLIYIIRHSQCLKQKNIE